MKPIYQHVFSPEPGLSRLLAEVPWIREADTRSECFMASVPYSYTYGQGRGVRTYTSVPFCAGVAEVMERLNERLALLAPAGSSWAMNGCFLNLYLSGSDHLGWHADDFRGMDHTRPVVSVSYGEPREIWWRELGASGVVPPGNRQLLGGDGSMFVMPPGMQFTHQHRVPKGDRPMGARVSMTFRAFLDV